MKGNEATSFCMKGCDPAFSCSHRGGQKQVVVVVNVAAYWNGVRTRTGLCWRMYIMF